MKKVFLVFRGFLKKIIVFNLLFLSLLLFQTSRAADNQNAGIENVVGTIDMLAVYAYHPSMQYYDYEKKLFIRPFKANMAVAEFNASVKSRFDEQEKIKSQYRNDFQKFNNEIEGLSKRINDIDARKAGEIYQVNQSGSAEMAKMKEAGERDKKVKAIQEDIGKIEAKYLKEKQDLTAKLEKTAADREELRMNVLKVHYMTQAETEKEFEKINKQIDDAIKYAMGKKGVKILLNVSQPFNSKTNENISETNKLQTGVSQVSIDTAMAPSYTAISEFFHSLEAPAGDLKNIQAQKKAKKELYSKVFNERNKLINIGSKYINNKTLVSGGTDLTLMVIFYNLKDVINREKAEYIQQVLQELGFINQ